MFKDANLLQFLIDLLSGLCYSVLWLAPDGMQHMRSDECGKQGVPDGELDM